MRHSSWQYSTVHKSICKIVEEQSLWGQTVCRIWLEKLKVFRLKAVRAGFKKTWQEREYAPIIAIAKKIPEKNLQEDPKLLIWYDQAMTRSGEET